MTQQHTTTLDPRVLAAVTELETLIRGRYPDATFEVSSSADDPDAINLYATVDATDSDDVLDVVLQKLDHAMLEVLRLRAVGQYEAGAHPEDVAATLGLHRKTVYGWLAKCRPGWAC